MAFCIAGGTYTTIDDPSTTGGTILTSINDLGQIVGHYDDASGNHGFLYSGGTYTTIDDPLATWHCREHQRSGSDRRVLRLRQWPPKLPL